VIVGVGIDIASVERFELSLARFGERFWQRILTPQEQAQLSARRDRACALAGRFAAKEAATKALGGPPEVSWHHIEVLRGPGGKPELHWHGPALEIANRLGLARCHLSISHDAGVAAAVVVLETI
jgi:holo-[acyl-carrier protein] synthase